MLMILMDLYYHYYWFWNYGKKVNRNWKPRDIFTSAYEDENKEYEADLVLQSVSALHTNGFWQMSKAMSLHK